MPSRKKNKGRQRRDGNTVVWFHYNGQAKSAIPRNVTHVRIHPSAKVIVKKAFCNCQRLVVVEVCEGVEKIEALAFCGCVSLKSFKVPSTVRWISRGAFTGCSQLVLVELCEGIEKIQRRAFGHCKSLACIKLPSSVKLIGVGAFEHCTSLLHIKIPSAVKVIDEEVFYCCDQLETVELCEGLEQVKDSVFKHCKSLKGIKIPSTVKEIVGAMFHGCELLEEVELCEGLEQIGLCAFYNCKSLKHFKVPSTVKIICGWAFCGCHQLMTVELSKRLEQIGEHAFNSCKALKCVKVPSTLKMIGRSAFSNCEQLVEVELCEGLQKINESSFWGCKSLKSVKVPTSVKRIEEWAFSGCLQLITMELCNSIEKVDRFAIDNCFSLRNVALPPDAQALQCFERCFDLLKVFGSYEMVDDALKIRFDGLPIHAVCYYQSYQSKDMTIEQIDDILDPMPPLCPLSNVTRNNQKDVTQAQLINEQDCLGMTPLHILACSTKHDIEMYKLIVFWYPDSLITEDKWGSLPLLYAMWGGAPPEIIQFLVCRQTSVFPNHVLDWDKMIETLCRSGASLDTVNMLFDTQQTSFSEQSINWQKAARELTIHCLITCKCFAAAGRGASENDWKESFVVDWGAMIHSLGVSGAHQELVQSLRDIQQSFFANQNDVNLRMMSEELVQPLKGWWRPAETYKPMYHSMSIFRFLVKCNIAERFDAIRIRKWRNHIKNLVEMISTIASDHLDMHFDKISFKLVSYEREYQLRSDAAFLLELALWKSRISEQTGQHDQLEDANAQTRRRQCRVDCGADTIIPNVLSYLIIDTEDSAGLGHSLEGKSLLNDAVVQYIKTVGANTGEVGVNVYDIIRQLQVGGVTACDITNSLKYLVNEGHIYSTIDEEHYQLTMRE